MLVALDYRNGSHWDVLISLPVLLLVLWWYLAHARAQKRARIEEYEQRAEEWRRGFPGGEPFHYDDVLGLYVGNPQMYVRSDPEVEVTWEPAGPAIRWAVWEISQRVYDQEADG